MVCNVLINGGIYKYWPVTTKNGKWMKNWHYYCTLSLTCTRFSKKNTFKVLPFAIVLLRKPALSSAVSGPTVELDLLLCCEFSLSTWWHFLAPCWWDFHFVFPFLTVREMDHLPDVALCYVVLSTCSYSNHATLPCFAPHHRWAVGFYHWKDKWLNKESQVT